MILTLPKTSETNQIRSPYAEAPSPTSSTGSDLELPDAYLKPGTTAQSYRKPPETQFSLNMDLDSRITSFLASGSQAIAVSIDSSSILCFNILFNLFYFICF